MLSPERGEGPLSLTTTRREDGRVAIPGVGDDARFLNSSGFEADKRAVYRHPLFPLLAFLLEKCEEATTSSDHYSSESLALDLQAFVQHQREDSKPFLSNDPEVDSLMIRAIQVLRIHLSELEKVQELCKDFCTRYINSLKGKMRSENLLRLENAYDSDSSERSDCDFVADQGYVAAQRLLNAQDSNSSDALYHSISSPSVAGDEGSSSFSIDRLPRPDAKFRALNPGWGTLTDGSRSPHLGHILEPSRDAEEDDESSNGPGKRKAKRGILPKQATTVLKSWLFQHIVHPYPTEDEKRMLASQTNLTLLQVNNWFINARRRILQPMLDASSGSNIQNAPCGVDESNNDLVAPKPKRSRKSDGTYFPRRDSHQNCKPRVRYGFTMLSYRTARQSASPYIIKSVLSVAAALKAERLGSSIDDDPKLKDLLYSARSDDSDEDDDDEDEDSDSDFDERSPNSLRHFANFPDQEEVERGVKRRRECMAGMTMLEQKFGEWKQEYFALRIKKVDVRLNAAKSGDSQEYVRRVASLRDTQYRKNLIAWQLNERKLRCAHVIHEARKLQIKQTLENEKWHLSERLREEIMEEIQMLDEEHTTLGVLSDVAVEKERAKREEAARLAEFAERRKKPVTVSGPHVVLNLDEDVLLEDWAYFKRLVETPYRPLEYHS